MTNGNNTARFTAPNIAAVLRALPDTDGTYHDVIRQVSEYGVALCQSTLGKWVSSGRSDIKANRRQTAYARFALKYDQLKREHCTADANRTREFDLALQILEGTCDCATRRARSPTAPSPTPAGSARTSRTKDDRPGDRRKGHPPSTPPPTE